MDDVKDEQATTTLRCPPATITTALIKNGRKAAESHSSPSNAPRCSGSRKPAHDASDLCCCCEFLLETSIVCVSEWLPCFHINASGGGKQTPAS